MILAGDIGGTKSYLGVFDWKGERVAPLHEEKYWNADFGSFEEVLQEFLHEVETSALDGDPMGSEHAGEESGEGKIPLSAACLGVAGPVVDNQCRATNLPWVIDGPALQVRFGIPRVQLLNDLEAMAHGILVLRPDELEGLNPKGVEQPEGAKALIAAGTGLGEAIIFWDGQKYHPCPSEGGHASLAPTSDTEIELLRYLRTRHLHVSFERVVSGEGLHSIYQFLRDTKKNEPTWFAQQLVTGNPPALIAEAALKGTPEICVQALEVFVSLLGAEAGNLALKCLARGGVYVGGGIAPKILPKLRDGSLVRSFVAKGRYQRLLSTIPVWVILNDQAGLLGAASFGAGLASRSS